MGKIKDEMIVAAVLTHKTNKEAAESLNLSESQLYQRMNTTEYRDLLNNTVMAQLEGVAGMLRNKLISAIDTISEIAEDQETTASVRLQAANSLISHYCNLSKLSRGAREINEGIQRESLWDEIMRTI